MSPKKMRKPGDGLDSADMWRTSLLVVSLTLLLLLAPIVYRLTSRLVEEDLDQTISSSGVAFLATFVFSVTFMLASNSYIRHISQHVMRDYKQQLQSYHHNQRMTFFYKLFSGLASGSRPSNNQAANDKTSASFYSPNNSQDSANPDSNSRRKIDPKYFKPRFILNELITFWDTTCTVITWGSFYVIGGTIVATEKITQKIKSMPKSPGHRDSSSSFFGDTSRHSSRGTGQSNCSFGSTSSPRGGTSTSQQQQQQQQPHHQQTSQTYRKISAWTKRSISSIKKKYSRAVRSNAPQLTSGPSSDSGSHIFFFGSPNSSAAA